MSSNISRRNRLRRLPSAPEVSVNNRNIQLLPPNGGMQAPPMVLATPFNDVQLLGMMAAQVASTTNDDAEACVRKASDLLFEAIVEQEKFSKRVADWRRSSAGG